MLMIALSYSINVKVRRTVLHDQLIMKGSISSSVANSWAFTDTLHRGKLSYVCLQLLSYIL